MANPGTGLKLEDILDSDDDDDDLDEDFGQLDVDAILQGSDMDNSDEDISVTPEQLASILADVQHSPPYTSTSLSSANRSKQTTLGDDEDVAKDTEEYEKMLADILGESDEELVIPEPDGNNETDIDHIIDEIDRKDEVVTHESIDTAIGRIRNPLQRIKAKEEQLYNVVGNRKMVAPLRTKRSQEHYNAKNHFNNPNNSPHNSVLRLTHLKRISQQLQQNRDKSGTPTSAVVHSKFIAVGTSMGLVLVYDHFQQLTMALGSFEHTKTHGAVTALDISYGGDYLVAGHQGGQLVVWDVLNQSVLKRVDDAHEAAVVGVKFWKRDKIRVVTVDSKGYVSLFSLTKLFFSYTTDKQCLLNGNAGQILAMAVLFSNPKAQHPCDQFSLMALANHDSTLIVALEPTAKVLFQLPRPEEEHCRIGALPSISWRHLSERDIPKNDQIPVLEKFGDKSEPGVDTSDLPVLEIDGKNEDCLRNPLIAITRGRSLQLVSVFPEFSSTISATGVRPVTGLHPKLVQSLVLDHEFVGCQWLGGQVLVAVTDRHELHVIDPIPIRELEVLDITPIGLVYHELFYNPITNTPEMSFYNSIQCGGGLGVGENNALLLLGFNRLEKGKLLSWSDRVNILVERGEWIEALALALDFYEGYGTAAVDLPRDPKELKEALGPRIAQLLQSYVDLALGSAKSESTPLDIEHLQILGGVAIDYCVSIDRSIMLFDSIYPQFCKVGGNTTFLELLEPYILNKKLDHLNADVLSAFVEHHASQSRTDELEQCILRMDIKKMDAHLAISLCREHNMFSALIYVYNQGLNDYVSPVDDILSLIIDEDRLIADAIREEYGYKLMLYIQFSLGDRAFPIGALPDESLKIIKSSILSHLFSKHSEHSKFHFAQSYEPLRYLLKLNARETLKLLKITFNDELLYPDPSKPTDDIPVHSATITFESPATTDSLENEPSSLPKSVPSVGSQSLGSSSGGSELYNESPTSSPSGFKNPLIADIHKKMKDYQKKLPSKIAAVNAAVKKRLDDGKTEEFGSVEHTPQEPEQQTPQPFRHRQRSAEVIIPLPSRQTILEVLVEIETDDSKHSDTGWKDENLTELYKFAAANLASGVVSASVELMNRIFYHLLTSQIPGQFSAADSGRENELNERQATLLGLLNRCVEKDILDELDVDDILMNADSAMFHKVCLFLHNHRRDYQKALDSHMRDMELTPKIFDYISELLNSGLPVQDIRHLKGATLKRLPELVEVDSEATARLIIISFDGNEHKQVMDVLEKHPQLQFQYLKSIMAKAPRKYKSVPSQSTLDPKEMMKEMTMTEILKNSSFVLTSALHETYINLLCRFSPNDVYLHLSSHDNYQIDKILEFCRKHNIKDATAYLYERTGDVNGALDLMLETVNDRVESLRMFFEETVDQFDSFDPNEHLNEPENYEHLLKGCEQNKNLENIIQAATALCQRHSKRQDEESRRLWFSLLDALLKIRSQQYKTADEEGESSNSLPLHKVQRVDALMALALVRLVRTALTNMMGFVALPIILRKITQDHASDQFREFRDTITGMLDTYRYEKSILRTANNLLESDMFKSIERLHRTQSHAMQPTTEYCGKCQKSLTDFSDTRKSAYAQRIAVYPCGHAFHEDCQTARGKFCTLCQVEDSKNQKQGRARIISSKEESKEPDQQAPSLASRHAHSTRAYVQKLDLMSRFLAKRHQARSERQLHLSSGAAYRSHDQQLTLSCPEYRSHYEEETDSHSTSPRTPGTLPPTAKFENKMSSSDDLSHLRIK